MIISDNRDHSECCSARRVPASCQGFCKGEPRVSDFSGLLCVAYVEEILACFREGYGQYFLSVLSVSTFCQYFVSVISLSTLCQYFLSILSVSTFCQYFLTVLSYFQGSDFCFSEKLPYPPDSFYPQYVGPREITLAWSDNTKNQDKVIYQLFYKKSWDSSFFTIQVRHLMT